MLDLWLIYRLFCTMHLIFPRYVPFDWVNKTRRTFVCSRCRASRAISVSQRFSSKPLAKTKAHCSGPGSWSKCSKNINWWRKSADTTKPFLLWQESVGRPRWSWKLLVVEDYGKYYKYWTITNVWTIFLGKPEGGDVLPGQLSTPLPPEGAWFSASHKYLNIIT